jgi:hypothetical protein
VELSSVIRALLGPGTVISVAELTAKVLVFIESCTRTMANPLSGPPRARRWLPHRIAL